MLRRPRPQETEEDLLKLQEEFLKQPNTTNILKRKSDISTVNSEKEIQNEPQDLESNQMATDVDNSSISNKRVRVKETDNEDGPEIVKGASSTWIEDGPSIETVLLDIIERDTASAVVQPPKKPTGQPFPKVFHRDRKMQQSTSKMSIFAQQLRKFKVAGTDESAPRERTVASPFTKHNVMPDPNVPELDFNSSRILDLGETSCIIDGSGLLRQDDKGALVKEIHDENVKRLSKMSEEDILMEQQQLIQVLNPDLVLFLKSKRAKRDCVFSPSSSEASNDNLSHEGLNASAATSRLSSLPSVSIHGMEVSPPSSVSVTNSHKSELNVGELPISLSEAKQWVHMDKIEEEKLAWMTSLPQPKPIDPKTGYQARFDFDGALLSHNLDVPVHQGLHHHGEEPEVPGYTLEELLVYSRSAVLQQKVLGLTTLSKIFAKCKEGWYDYCLSEPILPQVLSAGIVPMLRWILDDNTEGSLTAVIAALHSLVVSVPDEVSLDHTFLWYRGEEIPMLELSEKDLKKHTSQDQKPGDKAREDELTDDELINLDVIKGLLRMDLLIRLRYVLEVCRPASPVVVQILEILIRIARHSLDAALQVMRCPRLMSTIFIEFLPQTWIAAANDCVEQQKVSRAHGVPLPQAVKLIQVLASVGRHVAIDLLHKYNIMDSLLCYASIDPTEGHIPTLEAMKLCLTSYKAWTVFLNYGLAVNSFVDFYPCLMRHLQFCQTLKVDVDVEKNSFSIDHAAALFKLLTAFLKLTFRDPEADFHLQSCQLENIFMAAELCLKKWLWELTKADEMSHASLRLVANVLSCICTFCEKCTYQESCKTTKILNSVTDLYNRHLLPFMESATFKSLLPLLSRFSVLGSNKASGRKRDPLTLPSLGSVLWDGHLCPVLDVKSPFVFFTQLTLCLYMFHRLHRNLNKAAVVGLLDDPTILSYLRFLMSKPHVTTASDWFVRFETHFLYHLLLLYELIKSNHNLHLYYEMALYLLPRLQKGDEDSVTTLMTTVIFNVDLLKESQDLNIALEDLRLQEINSLGVTSIDKPHISHYRLLQHTYLCIQDICDTYKYYFKIYWSISNQKRWRAKDGLCIPQIYDCLVPYDLFYLPITVLYRIVSEGPEMLSKKELIKDWKELNTLKGVLHCLQWCHFLETWRKDSGICLSASVRFCRLSLIFLISSDLFLNSDVRDYLEYLLRKMADKGELSTLNLEDNPQSGLASFHDLYMQLLSQFEGISYGDHLFGMFVIIPMQQHHSLFLRRALWTEHLAISRCFGIGIKELLVPLKSFLFPVEDDKDLLLAYFKALINGYIRPTWSPILYAIAVHHVHSFLFRGSSEKLEKELVSLQKQMLSKLAKLPLCDENVLWKHLLGYEEPNENSDLGFTYSETPPEMVLRTLKQVGGTSGI